MDIRKVDYKEISKQCYTVLEDFSSFDVGDGWYQLILDISTKIHNINLRDKSEDGHIDCVVVQIKEKYGILRYYVNTSTPEINDLINDAEELSGYICELCGSQSNRVECKGGDGQWMSTRCRPNCVPDHIEQWSVKLKEDENDKEL